MSLQFSPTREKLIDAFRFFAEGIISAKTFYKDGLDKSRLSLAKVFSEQASADVKQSALEAYQVLTQKGSVGIKQELVLDVMERVSQAVSWHKRSSFLAVATASLAVMGASILGVSGLNIGMGITVSQILGSAALMGGVGLSLDLLIRHGISAATLQSMSKHFLHISALSKINKYFQRISSLEHRTRQAFSIVGAGAGIAVFGLASGVESFFFLSALSALAPTASSLFFGYRALGAKAKAIKDFQDIWYAAEGHYYKKQALKAMPDSEPPLTRSTVISSILFAYANPDILAPVSPKIDRYKSVYVKSSGERNCALVLKKISRRSARQLRHSADFGGKKDSSEWGRSIVYHKTFAIIKDYRI